MKKFKSVIVVMLVVMMLAAFAGCSGKADWDAVKREDIVAQAGSIQMSKKAVLLQYAIDEYSNASAASMFGQLGGLGDFELDAVEMDDSYNFMLSMLALAKIAEDEGILVTQEEAYESAYREFILNPKMYDTMTDYVNTIKSSLYLSDELVVEYSAEHNFIKLSAYNAVKKEFEKLNPADYEDLDAMSAAVLENVNAMMKDASVTALVPRTKTVKGKSLDYSKIVDNVKWNYNELYL